MVEGMCYGTEYFINKNFEISKKRKKDDDDDEVVFDIRLGKL